MRAPMILGAVLALSMGCEESGGETGDPQPQPAATGEVAEATPAGREAQAGAEEGEAEEAPIPELEVTEVATLLDSGGCVVVDANSESTRERFGTIPGATLLTSSGRYDPASELPDDPSTKLVFYCSNDDCRASDGAAGRAREAGYSDVNVMRAGIAGWAQAGKETAPAT